MKSCIDRFIEESTPLFRADSSRRKRLLTEAEVEELLRDLPGQVVAFCRETSRAHSKIA